MARWARGWHSGDREPRRGDLQSSPKPSRRCRRSSPPLASGEEILSVLELIKPPPGTELQRRGAVWRASYSRGRHSPQRYAWGASSSRRASRRGSPPPPMSAASAAHAVRHHRRPARRRAAIGFRCRRRRRASSSGGARLHQAPMRHRCSPARPSARLARRRRALHCMRTSASSHIVYRVARRSSSSPRPMSWSRKLTPRTTPYHLRRPPPPPPPFASLTVAALLGDGGSSRVLLVRKKPGEDFAVRTSLGHGASPSRREEYALKIVKSVAAENAKERRKGPRETAAASGAHQAAREHAALAACNHQFLPRLEGACEGYLLMEAVSGCELFYLLREVHRFERLPPPSTPQWSSLRSSICTARSSSTATSSRRTSCSMRRAISASSTSASAAR